MSLTNHQAKSFNLKQIGWTYNSIRKKAMEQEFSWSGLFTSLSIAFFIIIISASTLRFVNQAITTDKPSQQSSNKIYYLESSLYLSSNLQGSIKNIIV